MGAIQNTLNTALGAVAGATIGAKKLGAQAEAKALEKVKLGEEIPKMKLEQIETTSKLEENEKQLAQVKTGRNTLGQFRTKASVNRDIEMLTLSRQVLEGHQKALGMQLQQALVKMNRR